ncbi:MAG TPA: BON domain-containing protein [Pirellulaceae bacterium]|nr:BON domain-containing protein [Pirellulaceae bacterium]
MRYGIRGDTDHEYFDKLRAERACKQVDGVREVQSMIRVRPVSASDDQVSRDIETRWKQDRLLESSQIKAIVRRHVVTIQGTAHDQAQKRRAEQLAREVRGRVDSVAH